MLSRARSHFQALELKRLERPEGLEPPAAERAPWWVAVLNDDDGPRDRDRSIVLMALPAQEAPATPSWSAISGTACERFALVADASGLGYHLNALFLPIWGASGSCETALCGGRAALARAGLRQMPHASFGLAPSREGADRRRARRRARKAAPAAWLARLGPFAEPLWRSGARRERAFKGAGPTAWAILARALAEALLAHGAAEVWRVPDFFERHPDAHFDHWKTFERIDAERRDPLRSRWDVERAAGVARKFVPAPRRACL